MNADTQKRRGNKWTVTELLQLQREYELLEWTVQQIAEKHQRSVTAILYRLEDEGFINIWSEARGYKMGSDYDSNVDSNVNDDVHNNVEIEFGGDDNDSEYICEDNDENSWNEDDANSSISEDVGDDNTITSNDRLNKRLDDIEETLAGIKNALETIIANTQQKNSNLNISNVEPDDKAIYKSWM
jgi:hypothetical protein